MPARRPRGPLLAVLYALAALATAAAAPAAAQDDPAARELAERRAA